MSLNYYSISLTDQGRVRGNNEDNFYSCGYYKINPNKKKITFRKNNSDIEQLYAVFDGMGGYEDGEKASLIVAEVLDKYALSFNHRIPSFVEAANDAICDYRTKNKCMSGSTYVSLYIYDDKAYISNIGDSKAFLIRNGVMKQINEDHTEIQYMIKTGRITKEEAKKRKESHVLTQCLGVYKEDMIVEAYVAPPFLIKENDRFLLCSDGLTDMLSETELESVITRGFNIRKTAKDLLNLALVRGGKDNITIILVEAKALSNFNGAFNGFKEFMTRPLF